MRRTTISLSAVLMLLAFAPAGALAHNQHRRHHRHARVERFGRDVTGAPMSSSSADNAGTVQSFSNGVLTIMLGDGSTVSGAVTDGTEIECMAPEQSQAIHEDGDGGSGDQSASDDQSGSGDQSGSDDQAEGQDDNDAAEQNDENQMENNCSTADLSQGTVVHEAELRISSAGAVWKKLELGS